MWLLIMTTKVQFVIRLADVCSTKYKTKVRSKPALFAQDVSTPDHVERMFLKQVILCKLSLSHLLRSVLVTWSARSGGRKLWYSNCSYLGSHFAFDRTKRSFATDCGRTGSAPLFCFRKDFKGRVKIREVCVDQNACDELKESHLHSCEKSSVESHQSRLWQRIDTCWSLGFVS